MKYADLSQNRVSDYVFSWDKMLAMDGNTAAYMQYAYARCRSILRKAGVSTESLSRSVPKVLIGQPAERALAIHLLRLGKPCMPPRRIFVRMCSPPTCGIFPRLTAPFSSLVLS